MSKLALINLSYLLLLVGLTVVGLAYDQLSEGLATLSDNGPFFCRKLMSSGNDDDAMVLAFAVFAAPLTQRVLRFTAAVSIAEIIAFTVATLLTASALVLANLDCASVVYTAFVLRDPLLLPAIIAIPISAAILLWLRNAQRN